MIRWLLARAAAGLDSARFLHPDEQTDGARYRHPGRHRQFLLGRAAAKALLLRHLATQRQTPAASELCIRRQADGSPLPCGPGGPLPLSLSIAHSGEHALVALCPAEAGRTGVDLEPVAPRSLPLMEDFFTDNERHLVLKLTEAERALPATAIWCLKEAVLKAQLTGLQVSAKTVEVRSLGSAGNTWTPALVLVRDQPQAEAWWRLSDQGRLVLALASLPP